VTKTILRAAQVLAAIILLSTVKIAPAASLDFTAGTPLGSVAWNDVIYANGMFVAVGDDGNTLSSSITAYSTDGMNWQFGSVTGGGGALPDNGILGVTYGNGTFVGVGWFGTVITSTDGINWQVQDSGIGGNDRPMSVAYGNGAFVLSGAGFSPTNSAMLVYRSVDNGVTWTKALSTPAQVWLNGIDFVNNLFVIAGDLDTILTSPDGLNWTYRSSGVIATEHMDVAFGAGNYVSVGDKRDATDVGEITVSSDSITWSRLFAFSFDQLRSVAFGAGRFVAVGRNGEAAESSEGTIWASVDSDTGIELNGIAFGNNRFVAVGRNGIISTAAAVPPGPTVRMQLDATSTSFFNDFTIIFDDTGDGLLQQEEIVFFSGVAGTEPSGPMDFSYSGVAYVPPIPGVSTASGTINPNLTCAQCWEFTPSNLGDVSDGWFDTRWTYNVTPPTAPTQTLNFSYTFDGTDGNAWSPGATLSGDIQGTIQADGDTVIIESFGTVVLTRPGLPDLTYASIENDEFNAYPNLGEVPVMSFSGLKNNFRSCPEGFTFPYNDCGFGNTPGGGFLMSFDPSIFMGSWITAADGTGNVTCAGSGPQSGCRVQDRPINLGNWNLEVEVPLIECTTTAGGCNPTGGHAFTLPDNFVVPPGAILTQTATHFIDPRADEFGRCDGLTPLVLLDGALIIPPEFCGSPGFEVLTTETNIEILEGTIESRMFPEVFVDNPFGCDQPIIGDPQEQDIVIWQPTDSADVIEGHALQLTFDCGSSRGKTRRFSFFVVGMHFDFGIDFDLNPQAVTQAFIDHTSIDIESLLQAVENAEPALDVKKKKKKKKGDYSKLLKQARSIQKRFEQGRYDKASREIVSFLKTAERAKFDTEIGFNHQGNLISRASSIKFTLDEKIIFFLY
jgi:hypothetical protein